MDPQIAKQLSTTLAKLDSGIEKLALEEKPLIPNAELIIGPATGTIPHKCKSFNIINIGLNGLNAAWVDIPVTGIVGLTAVSMHLKVFGYSIENDQNYIVGPVVVSPPANHHVIIQYLVKQ